MENSLSLASYVFMLIMSSGHFQWLLEFKYMVMIYTYFKEITEHCWENFVKGTCDTLESQC